MRRNVTVAAILLTLLITGLAFQRLTATEDTITVTAHFVGVPGLYEGNDVAVLGLPVGSVEKIEPRGREVEVTLTIPSDLKVPANATASVVPASLVTDRYVELGPPYTKGPVMADGAHIPVARTQVPAEFDDIVRSLSSLAGDLSQIEGRTGAIEEFLGVSARNARGNGEALRRAIAGTSAALSAFAKDPKNTKNLVRSLARLASLLASSDDTIRSFGKTVADTTAFMAAESTNLNRALGATLDMVARVEAFVRENKSSLKDGMEDLDVTAQTLAGRTREISEAVDLLPLLFENLHRAYDPARRTLRARVEAWEGLLTLQEFELICREASRLPACSLAGNIMSLGSDLGLTELLLGTLSGAVR